MQEATGHESPPGEKAREERSRLLLLAAVGLVVGGVLIASGIKAPLGGKIEASSHVKARAKEQVDRNFKEGVAQLKAKQYEKAMSAFHRVLELAPDMPEAHVNAGFALLGMGNARAAADFFSTATELKSDQLNAYFGLGEALAELGDDFGAMQAMETYIHLAPKNDPFRRKAEAAAWELRAKLDAERAKETAAPAKEAAVEGKSGMAAGKESSPSRPGSAAAGAGGKP